MMRKIIKRVGSLKGKQSVLISVSTQNNPGASKYLRVGHTNKFEIWDLINTKIIPLFEDKVNKSFVLWYIHELKASLKDENYKNVLRLLNSLEMEVKR